MVADREHELSPIASPRGGITAEGSGRGGLWRWKPEPRWRDGPRCLAVVRHPHRVHRPQRSKVSRQFRVDHLEDALRILEISQAVHAERLQRRPRRERVSKCVVRGPGEQDLPAMPGFEHAGHPAERRPKIVPIPQLRLPGVERHAHAQRGLMVYG